MHARALTAEVVGTLFVHFVLFGMLLNFGSSTNVGALPAAVATGLALMAATTSLGHVSGGHFNPAITIGLIAGGRFDVAHAPGFIIAQIFGAVLAAAVYYIVISAGFLSSPANAQLGTIATISNGFGAQGYQSLVAVLIFESLAAALLVMIFMGATASRSLTPIAPLAIGATLAGLYLILIPISGGGLNPARSTATAVFAGAEALSQLWAFWIAPTIGAVAGGLVARFLLNEASEG
ncbi:MAG: aquaporin [Pseudomonadota bacterium]